jgi:uncharacterized protein (UPF0332 family)
VREGSLADLARSRQELAAARLLADNGFAAQAVSRAYYAAFYAAEAALLRLDQVRSKHAGVIAAVARVLVAERGLDPHVGRLLRSLFERRSRADFEAQAVPAEEAARAVTDATFVVEALTTWLIGPSRQEPTTPE